MPSAFHHVAGLRRAAGFSGAGSVLLRRMLKARGASRVHVRGVGDLEVRPDDSDLFVLSQIFGWEEYKIQQERLDELNQWIARWQAVGLRPLIIDAGANVGYSTLYFNRLFPTATILAIEPDPASFEILCRHVEGRPNIKPRRLALWSHDRGLSLHGSTVGSWGNRTREGSGTPSERLDALVATVPSSRILLIKMDIEGAEREVVESCPEVFAQAKCIMIEPHDFCSPRSACLSPLFKIASVGRHDTILNGENLFLFANGADGPI